MTDTARKAGKPIWPRIPAGFVRAVLAGHSSLGLAFAALIYLVCFSGTVAVFAREFQRWEHPQVAPVTAMAPAAMERAAIEAIARSRAVEHVFVTTPTPEIPRPSIFIDGDGPDRTWLADGEGRVIGPGEAVWTKFMTALHINLHLPRTWGEFIVGLTGVALLSSLIAGVLAHPRVFKDAFHLRWGGSKRLQEADLHNRLGVWALPFHVIVSTTGALLGLTTIIVGFLALAVFQGDMDKAYDLFLPPHPVDDPRPAIAAPKIASAVEQALERSPGGRISLVGLEHPTERGAGILVNVVHPNLLAATDTYTFDGQGRLISEDRVKDANVGEKVLGSIGVLHFGWFGGAFVKIGYGLLGLALCAVTSSGVAIWLARRRDKGRPAPRWERLWAAAVWGQPFAFAGSALVGVTPLARTFETLPLIVWLGLTVAAGLMTTALTPTALSRWLRLGAGALLVLTAMAWSLFNARAVADSMGWVVTAVLTVLGLLLAWSAMRRARPIVAER